MYKRFIDLEFLWLAVYDAIDEAEKVEGKPVYLLEVYQTFMCPKFKPIER